MVLSVEFKDEQEKIEVRAAMRSIVRKAIFNTLAYDGFEKQIRELNNQYRNKDCATDVLSFPMFDNFSEMEMLPEPVLLGDIVISLERAMIQGHHLYHSIYHEVAFLAVHSTLHLLGYDHETSKEDEEVMFAKQKEIMEIIGF